ncbi:hypothetical protein [Deinococcus radiopugnans]|uniref:Uncharacterized protein n=1 Tax=Deinococcus radiopugnans ATCC 19172 TaxID=585398 RepID=A0A5C4Y593_9DEIO|nr:hypothetical protein [Deinococcus radiopugnans]MBB6017056.1 hypothetical protein [Deinococcus radiopugnans ATCC 19172]TNM70709.1 hypothetical protein FHR04_12480 [Deinococcus radiopugnans ATCC 19172]
MVASTEFQVSLTLPAEVQNVGVNAAKQSVLIPTVDESDGRVIYLDVLKAGGFATLNIRLVNRGQPTILKLTVELSNKTGGVLSYTVRDDQTAAAPSKPAPAPLPRPPTAPVKTSTPPGVSKAQAVPNVLPVPAPASRPTARPPVPAPLAAPVLSSATGSPLRIDLIKDQAASTPTTDFYTYTVRLVGQVENLKFILLPKTLIRAGGGFDSGAVQVEPNRPALVTATGLRGRISIDRRTMNAKTSILLFTFSPVEPRTQKVLANRYVGVMVKR